MSTITFASLVPKITQSARGCPTPMAIEYIRDAAIRVCEATLAWRYAVPKYNLVPGIFEYLYSKPTGTEVHAVIAAVVNNQPLGVLTFEQAISKYPAWADIYGGVDLPTLWGGVPTSTLNDESYNDDPYNGDISEVLQVNGAGPPRDICQVTVDKFVVLPLPDDVIPYSLRMFVALKPSRTSTGLNDVVYNELRDVIVHSALNELLAIPDKEWMDKELATYHGKLASFKMAERRARTNLTNARGSLSVRMVPFGA